MIKNRPPRNRKGNRHGNFKNYMIEQNPYCFDPNELLPLPAKKPKKKFYQL